MVSKVNMTGGIKGLNRALRAFPKESRQELTDAAQNVAQDVVDAAKAATTTRQQAMVATTLKAKRTRTPRISMGGAKRLPAKSRGRRKTRAGNNQTYGNVVWGAEFGGGTVGTGVAGKGNTTQFPPHRGTRGYFLWPTIRRLTPESMEEYIDAVTDAAVKVARRG